MSMTWTEFIGVSEPNAHLSVPINKAQYEEIQMDARKELTATVAVMVGALKKYSEITDQLLNHCPICECEECAKIVCPFNEPLHLHHDGCPSCHDIPENKLGYQSALANTPLAAKDLLERVEKLQDFLNKCGHSTFCNMVRFHKSCECTCGYDALSTIKQPTKE